MNYTVWSKFKGSNYEWNDLIISNHGSPYQLEEWSNYKKCSSRWDSIKIVAKNNSEIVYAANVLLKKSILFTVCYIPSGGVGTLSPLDSDLYNFLIQELKVAFIYFRVSFQQEFSHTRKKTLVDNKWKCAKLKLGSDYTMIYDLSKNKEQRLLSASKNWRHNYKRSLKRDIDIHIATIDDKNKIIEMIRLLEKNKGLDVIFSDIEIQNILTKLKNILVLFYATNSKGLLLGMRGALISGKHAVDFIAATTNAGRKEYSSYALFWVLTTECKKRGVIDYDMGGVDKDINIGVYNFKKGTGSTLKRYLGGYEWKGSVLPNIAINVLVIMRSIKSIIVKYISTK